jgi:glycosyltransferase involved in cell wall biosynthesis
MLEAMSCGCALVLSDTEPVREFADPTMASLVDLARPEAIARAVLATLEEAAGCVARRLRARRAVVERLAPAVEFGRKQDLFRGLL